MADYTEPCSVGQSSPAARPSGASGAASLDTNYKIAVRNQNRGADEALSPIEERYFLQAAARNLLPGDRVAFCCRMVVPGKEFVTVQKRRGARNASFGNVARCERVWYCPVCAVRISEHRRYELTQAIADNPEYAVLLGTFTVGHSFGQPLRDVLALLQKAYDRFMGGRAMQYLKQHHEIDGFTTALEVTYGDNGWHPHIHVLIWVRWGGELDLVPVDERAKYLDKRAGYLHLDFWRRWEHIVTRLGGEVSPEAFDLRSTNDAVGDYLAKFGRLPSEERSQSLRWGAEDELTKAMLKKGRGGNRSPFQLLKDYANGDKQAGALFKEYAEAFKGKQQLRWSAGMREKLGLGKEATLDELVTADEAQSDILAELDLYQWRVVLQNRARGALLKVASEGDINAVWDFLDTLPGMQDTNLHYVHSVRKRERQAGIKSRR